MFRRLHGSNNNNHHATTIIFSAAVKQQALLDISGLARTRTHQFIKSTDYQSHLYTLGYFIMATRGVFQLNKLKLHYCEKGGSSRSIRDYIINGKLVEWARLHPHVEIEVKVRNGKHPFVQGDYRSSPSECIHQISVKNVDSWKDVQDACQTLFNRSGRKITKITTPVLTDTPSIQGVWTPFLNLKDEAFTIEYREE
jgi:large subunit ribosomal protein L43